MQTTTDNSNSGGGGSRVVYVELKQDELPQQQPQTLGGLTRSDWGKLIVGWLAALAVFFLTWYTTTQREIDRRPTTDRVDAMIDEVRATQTDMRIMLGRIETKIEKLEESISK